MSNASEALEINSRRKISEIEVRINITSSDLCCVKDILTLIRVDGVDNQRKQLGDFGLEFESLSHFDGCLLSVSAEIVSKR